ncbi:MAG: ferritin-like domain-containing protein [Candidatus Eremiobacteraeota bacterium]|nr:ferritin-like domain-containing protein [Candidatus Eremiobacteraeota bacterium]
MIEEKEKPRNGLVSRTAALGLIGTGALLGAACSTAGGLAGLTAPAKANGANIDSPTITDFDILNFALNLEYLEAEFYSFAVTGAGIASHGVGTSGVGTPGPTTGGHMVTFTDSRIATIAQQIYTDEVAHVKLLRGVLGSNAIAKPAIKLDALGACTSQSFFLKLSRALEDTGVSAYAGAAPLIQSKAILGTAAQILATEALHSGDIRLLVAEQNVTTAPIDSKDVLPPPSGTNYFTVDSMGLVIVRTTTQVIAIAGPFFPSGLNGTIH